MTNEQELDVRAIPKPQRHPLIFTTYDTLEAGQAILLVNDHEPLHLREEFDRELPGSFTWESLGEDQDGAWRVRITRTTRATLPRVVGHTGTLPVETAPGRGGSVWQLTPAARDLDANVISLLPGGAIETHDGPGLDVLLHILAGSGTLGTETGQVPLAPGALIWLPRRSQRRFDAGPEGLRYLSVHQRKPALSISAAPPARRTEPGQRRGAG